MKNAAVVLAIALVAGCTGGSSPTNGVAFEFIHPSHDETFAARTSDETVIAAVRAELAKPMHERALHIHGAIVAGDGGVNEPWSWSFVEGDWKLAEMSAEVCDGWPSYVEANLEEWLKLGSFCPWASRVQAEIVE
jgi:hypothetical protein